MSDHAVSVGAAEPLGVHADVAGVNVAVFSAHAEAIVFCLFDSEDVEVARIPLPARTGDVFHGHISGVAAGARYGLRAFGPWDPRRGHRFNPTKLLLDPFAVAIDRGFRLDPTLFDGDAPNPADSAAAMPKALVVTDETAVPARALFDWDGQVIYELHVRGFTMRHPDIPPALRGRFAALGHPASIEHLQRLGVTAVELMPSAAWIDERHLPPLGLSNYWGYNPVALLAPDPRLAPGGWAEVRAAVGALQAAGIAVLLDVVLNHLGESDHLGPTLSLRGLDNASYYRLRPDDPSRYVDDTGCGNTLALDRPPVLRLAMAALRGWVWRAGVDGFRFDLATTLGRRNVWSGPGGSGRLGSSLGGADTGGFDPAAPLLTAIAQDPLLRDRALIAEPWDVGPGGYRLGEFPAGWGEWNDRYRDTVRRFWRGDRGMLGALATRFAGSADVLAPRHRPLTRSVNFVTAHDGFTLADLVAYTAKRNAANGEANRDGTDAGMSWNNGVEGPCDDPAVRSARARDVRALLATLLLSRGTPMLTMGDECGRSQGGNNNAYAQDNALSWLDWPRADSALIDFVARLVRARRDCGVLTGALPLTGGAVDSSLIPDVEWRLPDGRVLAAEDWHCPDDRTLIAALYAPGSRALVVLHAGSSPIEVTLPAPRAGQAWRCVLDSAAPDRGGPAASPFVIGGRSVLLLVEVDGGARSHRRATDNALHRLAREAGIAASWWDIAGHEHRVGDDTTRALLAAMRLPAANPEDIADSEARLAAVCSRALPQSLVVRVGAPIDVPLGPAAHGGWLTLRREGGGEAQFPLAPNSARHLVVPPQPIGRHLLWLEGFPDAPCHLAVVPPRCHLPDDFSAGHRRFGIAAHLYMLRRAGDQGIGDFTTLAEFATAAAAQGAAVVGLNPLHALFPAARERASPYHPSDREFLDPIYIDVTALPGVPAGLLAESIRESFIQSGTHGRTQPGADSSAGAAAPDVVDYQRVWAAKRRVLEAAFNAGAADDPAFAAFVAAGGETLRRFATFEAIAEVQRNTHWWRWPEALRHPLASGVAEFAAAHADRVRFAGFLQFLADRQLAAAAQRSGLTLGLYRDLAVGAAPDGAEAWRRQDALLTGVSIGAPPDPFSASGQVWSLPPPDPLAMAREGFSGFAAMLAANMRHAGALRIDHAMGLQRLFLVPEGAAASDGAYLAYPLQDLLGQLALESHRASCLVVGEDLGTVPEGLPAKLAAAEVFSYRVLWFERDGSAFRPPAYWPSRAAACVSTHDLPTLAGWWEAADIAERVSLGLLDPVATQRALTERATDKAALLVLLHQEGLFDETPDMDGPIVPVLAGAVHALIAVSPALLALVQADDLGGETVAVNLPGTDRERANWRRRLRTDVAHLFGGEAARRIMAAMRDRGG
jgi:glycogen debranching enzyme GlgX/4-alpha-glucanotransferase